MTKRERLKEVIEKGKVRKSEIEEIGLTEEQIKEFEIEVINDKPETLEEAQEIIKQLNKVISERNEENKDKRLKSETLNEQLENLKKENEELKTKYDNLEKEKFDKAKVSEEFQSKLDNLEKELAEKNALLEETTNKFSEVETQLSTFKEREEASRLALLEKIPEAKRDKLKDASKEILEEFINTPRNSPNIEKTVPDANPKLDFIKY